MNNESEARNKSDDVVPLVSISCITFNHERYIAQAIDGFIMQKMTFPIEILIHDDASTDNTANIIRGYEAKYPEIIKPIYEAENQWIKGKRGSAVFNFPRARGKYIALCEGDDYWTDPYKLQKQIDFLEANPDYGMIHSDYSIFYQKESQMKKKHNCSLNRLIPTGFIFEDLLKNNFIVTPTVCLKKDILKEHSNKDIDSFKMGDYPLWLEIAKWTKVGYIEDPLAVYRVSECTASRPKELQKRCEFEESAFNVRKYFIDKYECSYITQEIVDINYHKFKLKYAYLYNNREIAREIYDYLTNKQKYERLHPDYFMYYFGTLNILTRIAAKFYFYFIEYKRRIIPVRLYRRKHYC